ncbi:MAG: DNA primase [Clostridia bacterium]|nr:DNA primase [Clostridia bacterium]
MHDLKKQNVWVCWKYVSKGGRMTKMPFAATGRATGTSPEHSGEWADFVSAAAAVKKPELGFDGIGFVMPEGYFLLDVDHRDSDDPVMKELVSAFPTYLERSPSGNGFHFYGKVDISRIPQSWDAEQQRYRLDGRYYTKNSGLGLELYIGGLTNRFATFTGNTEGRPEQIMDCTDAVLAFLEKFMKRPEMTEPVSEADDKYIRLSEEDIPEVVDALRSQKNGEKFRSMFDEGFIPDGLSQSEADASLCAMIAFRTGPDPEMIDAVFRESALYRDKWERSDYRVATIKAGICACNGVFHHSLKKRPPFVLNDGKKDYVSATLLAEYVRGNLSYRFVREADRNSYQKYVYRNGVYQIYSDDMFKGEIKSFVMDYDPMLLKMSVIDEAYKQLVTDLDFILQTELNADETLINFQNGLLDIRDLTIRPHSPEVLSSIKIPCDWTGEESPTPVFDKYLTILTSGDQETQTLLLEFMGACLSNVPGSRMKKSLFMYGPGDTGKSQLKRLTERLLGAGNYSGIDLQQMESRFGTSAIYGKRLAGTSDMSYMTVSELKTFKLATGGDSMFIEFKGQDSFQFEYRGMLWFCMNNLPKFGGDDGQWVFERILPIHCPNVLPPEKQDHELLDKMYAERGGIVYKAVMAFREVIRRGYRFTEPKSIAEERWDYKVENNTALEFFTTFMQKRQGLVKRDDPYTVTKVYEAYKSWYQQVYGDFYRKSKKKFFTAIADSLGTRYEDMTVTNAKGTVLRDYTPIPEAWGEYNLGDFVFGQPPMEYL